MIRLNFSLMLSKFYSDTGIKYVHNTARVSRFLESSRFDQEIRWFKLEQSATHNFAFVIVMKHNILQKYTIQFAGFYLCFTRLVQILMLEVYPTTN